MLRCKARHFLILYLHIVYSKYTAGTSRSVKSQLATFSCSIMFLWSICTFTAKALCWVVLLNSLFICSSLWPLTKGTWVTNLDHCTSHPCQIPPDIAGVCSSKTLIYIKSEQHVLHDIALWTFIQLLRPEPIAISFIVICIKHLTMHNTLLFTVTQIGKHCSKIYNRNIWEEMHNWLHWTANCHLLWA